MTTIGKGFGLVCHLLDSPRGIILAMLYRREDAAWYLSCGILGDDNVTWEWSEPRLVARAQEAMGCLGRDGAGTYYFSYISPEGNAVMVQCHCLNKYGVGEWK